MTDLVRAIYEIETALPLEQVADVMAGEQSSGTFVTVARETDELKRRFRATVASIEELPASGRPPLPGAAGDWTRARRARVKIDFPLHNFGPSLPNLLAAVAGNLFELREVGALRLLDLELPNAFADAYPGPAFGVDGTRKLIDRPDGPLIGTIVKPSVGLPAEQLAGLVTELADAGIDFIKDDELQGNPPHLPLAERVRVVTDALKRSADRTGRMPMYAFNITDDISRLAANHDLVRDAGGRCVMVCVTTLGLPGLQYLREHSELPIHGHRAMFGALSRSPQLGLGFVAFQKLARLAGADHLHTNGISQQVLRVRRGGAGLDRRGPGADVRRLSDAARALFRSIGRPRGGDVRSRRHGRPAGARRWRHPRSSDRPGGRRTSDAVGLGGSPGRRGP